MPYLNSTPALANTGVPMIFLTLPPMVVLLIPVILIEVFVAQRRLTGMPRRSLWLGATGANIVSTFIGWPIAWIILVVLQIVTGGGTVHGLNSPLGVVLSVTLQAPWLIPYESDLYWMVPIAMGVLLVPFYFVSVYSERYILYWLWKKENRANIRSFSWVSNLCSYLFLLLIVIVYGVFSIAR
jgi:hypothetical protein